MPAGHAAALIDPDGPAYIAPLARQALGMLSPLPELTEAFRTGEGVPYPHYGPDTREGIADLNRTMFINELGSAWFPSIEDVHARLGSPPGACVADLGCGSGWSSIAIARAYPHAFVDGIDSDPASIETARANARAEGLDDRVRFFVKDASDAGLDGVYDLVTIFEALHDMARPVEALANARRLLARERHGDRRRRARGGALRRPGRRPRAADVRLQRRPLPRGRSRRPRAVGRDRHRDAAGHPSRLRRRGGLQPLGGAADRERLLALLPPRSLNPDLTRKGLKPIRPEEVAMPDRSHGRMIARWALGVTAAVVGLQVALAAPPDAAARSGLERTSAASDRDPLPWKVAHASCPLGKQVVGGGAWIDDGGRKRAKLVGMQPVNYSNNESSRDGYRVTAEAPFSPRFFWSVTAYAMCVDERPGDAWWIAASEVSDPS